MQELGPVWRFSCQNHTEYSIFILQRIPPLPPFLCPLRLPSHWQITLFRAKNLSVRTEHRTFLVAMSLLLSRSSFVTRPYHSQKSVEDVAVAIVNHYWPLRNDSKDLSSTTTLDNLLLQGSHFFGLTKFHDISMIFPGFLVNFQVFLSLFLKYDFQVVLNINMQTYRVSFEQKINHFNYTPN